MITSLGRTVPPFTSCRAEWCRRALATSAYAETSSPSPMPPKVRKKKDTRSGGVGTHGASAKLFVRPWDGVPSMPDGFAMLRGIEQKYGKIRSFKFIRDGEIPSTYFSYFWVELEDPSSYSDSATSVLQVPVPELERNRPGGIGIADLQPLLRPSLESQEEAYEWSGVTERMVDEVDETKRTTQVYDLRIELSGKSPFRPSFQNIGTRKYFMLTQAFVKWGGFASSPAQGPEAAGTSTRPTFDRIIERAPPAAKPEQPPAAEDNEAPPVEEEPHKPFNYEFDEPVRSMDTKTPVLPKADKTSVGTPQSLLTMRREGERLSRKQKALLQAAAISRTPLLNFEAKEKEERETNDEAAQRHKAEMDEEKKRIHSKVWDLVRSKWF